MNPKNPFKILTIGVLLCFLALTQVEGQQLTGIVQDSSSGAPISYVHIGVQGKNIGVISNDKGAFSIDLSKMEAEDKVQFSIIGYKTLLIDNPQYTKDKVIIKLTPISYAIPTIVVKENKKVKNLKLGRYKLTKTTTGQSGIKDFGFGGEVGIKIKYPGNNYYLKEINFHTRFNTVDSVLYRLNVYEVKDGLPGDTRLQKDVYVTSYAKDKWISSNLLSRAIKIEEDVIVTFELVRLWFSSKGSNYLFYTHGKGYEEGQVYSRESSHDQWSINKREPIAMYITGVPE